MPFIVVSIVILLTFTGGLYFLLREEEKKMTMGILKTLNTTLHNKEKFITSLDAFPGETG